MSKYYYFEFLDKYQQYFIILWELCFVEPTCLSFPSPWLPVADFQFRRRLISQEFVHTFCFSYGEVELTWMAFMLKVLKVCRVAVVVLVVMIVSPWCSGSEAQLVPAEAAALKDLCDRPGKDLWKNCSDAANACINTTTNWPGIVCDPNNTAIIRMYDYDRLSVLNRLLIESWLRIRTVTGVAAGGSIPASIGNITQLQVLCVFLWISLTRIIYFDTLSWYDFATQSLYSHLYPIAFSGSSNRVSSVAPSHLSWATSLTWKPCTFIFASLLLTIEMPFSWLYSQLVCILITSLSLCLTGGSKRIRSLAPSLPNSGTSGSWI